jgi:16S rRNA (cytidine1402-2'-O)-methyltransferase
MKAKKNLGTLILVPSPLSEELPLEPVAREKIAQALTHLPAPLILFEEIKPARRRWLQWGLPRETIEHFVLYNEHGQESMVGQIIKELQSGRDVYLFSDGGLPAFCDPGRELVHTCQELGIKVTATPFPNSVLLALALSGFDHSQFLFSGFLPRQNPERQNMIQKLLKTNQTVICMDTAYRLNKTVEEFLQNAQIINKNPYIFLAMDLNRSEEKTFWGRLSDASGHLEVGEKRDFILLLAGH